MANFVYCILLLAALAGAVAAPAAGQPSDSSRAGETGRFDRVDPHGYRLLSKQTARPLGAGGVIASLTNVFLPQVAVGVTEAITLEGGVLALPTELGNLVVLTPSVRLLERRRLDVAVTARAFAVKETDVIVSVGPGGVLPSGAEERWRYVVAPRAVATYGTETASLTASVGVPLANQGRFDTVSGSGDLVLSGGGSLQLLNWLALVSENDLVLGVPFRVPSGLSPSATNFRDFVYEEGETTAVQTISGARLFWDHLAIDLAGGVRAYARSEFDREPQVFLRFSYRF
jgi:hypothetical protein